MQDNQSISWSHGLKFIHLMKNRAFHSGIKRRPYKAMFGCAPIVGLSTIHISREVFDTVEDNNSLKML